MKKNISILLIFLLISINLVACVKVTEKNNETQRDYAIYGVGSLPESLGVDVSLTDRQNDVICSLFEGLLEVDESGDIMPSLALAWKVSDDGIDYTFKLKKDIKWSDGIRITASDFVDFFKSILSPNSKNIYVNELYCIYGAKEYNNGKTTFEKGVAISAPDDATLKIRMNYKDDGFLKLLAKPRYRLRIVDNKLLDYYKSYKNIKYTGPYKIESVEKDTSLKLIKNTNYIGANESSLAKIQFKVTAGEEMSFAAFSTNKIDLLINPPISSLQNTEGKSSIDVFPTNAFTSLVFNQNDNISSSLEFRKGIWKSLMWEIFDSDLVKSNFQEVALGEFIRNNTTDKESMANSNITNNSQQKELKKKEANEIFSSLKLSKEKITLIALDSSKNRNITSFIKNKLADNNKLNIKVNLYEQEELDQVIKSGNYQMYLKDFTIDSSNIVSFLKLWSKGEENFSGFNDNEYEIIMNELKNSNNKEEQQRLIVKAETLLKGKLPFVPLYFNNMIWCKSENIKYLFIDSNGNILFKYTEGY